MEPHESATESGAVPINGRFEVVLHSLEFSNIGQKPDEHMVAMEVTTTSGQKLAISVPKNADPVPYVKEALRLAESGEKRGVISISQGEKSGR
jgi:hypothetical protein